MENNFELLYEIRRMKDLLKSMDKRLEDIEKECLNKNVLSYDKHETINGKLDLNNVWNSAKNIIKHELSGVSFNTWVEPMRQLKVEENIIYLQAPNDFSKSIIESKFIELIKNAIYKITNQFYTIEIIIGEDTKLYSDINDTIDHSLEAKNTFESIIIGEENELSYKSIFKFAEDVGKKTQLLYLYGDIGLGKTHTIQALGNYVLKNNNHINVKYMTMYEFTDKLIQSIRGDDKKFRESLSKKDLLIIDEFESIIGKERTQEEFYIIANSLRKMGKSLVIASNKSSNEINIMDKKLNSMLEIDKLVKIVKPELGTRIKILKLKLVQENIDMKDKHIEIIADKYPNNVRELINALNRVISFTDLTKRELSKEEIIDLLNGL